METIIKDSLKIAWPMGKEFINGRMEKSMKDFSKQEKETDMANICISTETFLKVSISMILNREKECSNGVMEKSTKDISKMI